MAAAKAKEEGNERDGDEREGSSEEKRKALPGQFKGCAVTSLSLLSSHCIAKAISSPHITRQHKRKNSLPDNVKAGEKCAIIRNHGFAKKKEEKKKKEEERQKKREVGVFPLTELAKENMF